MKEALNTESQIVDLFWQLIYLHFVIVHYFVQLLHTLNL
jgi:hypothetical protein